MLAPAFGDFYTITLEYTEVFSLNLLELVVTTLVSAVKCTTATRIDEIFLVPLKVVDLRFRNIKVGCFTSTRHLLVEWRWISKVDTTSYVLTI